MDRGSRINRALGQGFTRELFHGTSQRPRNILERADAFVEGREFNQFAWGTHAGTLDAAEDRLLHNAALGGIADLPNEVISEGARVFPVRVRGNFLEIDDLGTDWGPEQLLREAERVGGITKAEQQGALLQMSQLRQTEFLDEGRRIVQELFEEKGFQGVQYRNMVEDPGSMSFMIFDPSNIRSQFAAFDPRNLGLPGMLGGATGAALIGASAAAGRSRRQQTAR